MCRVVCSSFYLYRSLSWSALQPRYFHFPQAAVSQFEANAPIGVDKPHQLLGSAPQCACYGAYQREQWYHKRSNSKLYESWEEDSPRDCRVGQEEVQVGARMDCQVQPPTWTTLPWLSFRLLGCLPNDTTSLNWPVFKSFHLQIGELVCQLSVWGDANSWEGGYVD